MTTRRTAARRGFTLVEVALALLVVSIGIMSLFALFPRGLESGTNAINEMRAAAFAEDVFAAYRAVSVTRPWSSLDTAQIERPAWAQWRGQDGVKIRPGTAQPQVLRFKPMGLAADFTEFALRYRLSLGDDGPTLKTLSLEVWPGEFGTTDNPFVFYTEIYNWGT